MRCEEDHLATKQQMVVGVNTCLYIEGESTYSARLPWSLWTNMIFSATSKP